MYDNINQSYGISESYFNKLVELWKNKKFEDLSRHYYRDDGDAYNSEYPGKFDILVPICNTHRYQNKVQVSKSVFNFQKVDSSTIVNYHLFEYPEIENRSLDPILGYVNSFASKKLQQYNAFYGNSKQLHMMILIFNNQPYQAGVMQEAYWKGGNKNYFILCIGTSGKKITWTKVISWTNIEELKVKTTRMIKEMDTLNIDNIVEYMGKTIPKSFVRKQFKDFDYLTIEPTGTAIIITIIVIIAFSIGLSIFVVKNDIEIGSNKRFNYHFRR
jgi:hypothetical protein